jgi:putative transposase
MVAYRRNRHPSGIYFFTVTLKSRQSTLLTDQINILQNKIQLTKLEKPFKTIAAVILPDHIHALWQLPTGDSNYSVRWQNIKSLFTMKLNKAGFNLNKDDRGEYKLWQRRFWEHTIKSEEDLHAHINYIHYNPVKHGLVTRVIDWPYSSFHSFVKKGILEEDWYAFSDGDKSAFG